MGMMAFHLLFTDEAADECRTVVPVSISASRVERWSSWIYCADHGCDSSWRSSTCGGSGDAPSAEARRRFYDGATYGHTPRRAS